MPYFNQFNPNAFYGQQYQQQQIQMNQPNIIQVASVREVESWAVAPGNSLTFYVMSSPPMIATKTKSYNQLESPVTKYYDLTERTIQPSEGQKAPEASYATKDDIKALWEAVGALKQHSGVTEVAYE